MSFKTLMSQQTPTKYFTAMGASQTNLICGIPAGYVVCGVKILLLTQFVLAGSTSVKLSIGISEAAEEFYATQFELTSPATSTSLQITHADFSDGDNGSYINTPPGAHDIYAFFVANGSSYFSNLAQGELETTIMIRPL